MSEQQVGVLVVGAGPTGLGAATRLHQHSHSSWSLVDEAEGAGGLATTHVTPQGFLFDVGGHVIFSHYQYFDELLDTALPGPDEWNHHERVSYVWIKGRFVAYPFQNNISALPKADQATCLHGLVQAKLDNALAQSPPANFDEWILRAMGAGIADLFMRPYNFKTWAVPTTAMQCGWLGERVATVDVNRAITNVIEGREDAGWGPNATFRFPARGGTGAIWQAVGALLPAERQAYGADARVSGVDLEARVATLASGATIAYESMVSTMPLDVLLRMVGKDEWADRLMFSSSHVIGLGIRGTSPHGAKCWLYYPEDDCPFYRTTVFSHYAEANCPEDSVTLPTLCRGDGSAPGEGHTEASAGPYWSLMFEVSESVHKAVDQTPVELGGTAGSWPQVVKDTMLGAIATHLMPADAEIVSLHHRRFHHGYPTPSLDRDNVLREALPYLRSKGVWSRGRFGSYKYEVANQDHSCMLGVEAVDNILFGTKELTLHNPGVVNAAKNTEMRYNGSLSVTSDYLEASVELPDSKAPNTGQGHIIKLKLKDELDGSTGGEIAVYIGDSEYGALRAHKRSSPLERPMTHDLFVNVVKEIGHTVTMVRVTALRLNTYIARVHFEDRAGKQLDVDARPSDAINLAVRFKAPLYVHKSVAATQAKSPGAQPLSRDKRDIQKRCRAEIDRFHDPTVVYNVAMQVAVQEERFEDASLIRDKVEKLMACDPSLRIVVAMESALKDHRYEEALRLCMDLETLNAAEEAASARTKSAQP